MLIKVVLDLFVRYVDAQLLEGIVTKVLKTKDVQDADRIAVQAGAEKHRGRMNR